MDTTNPLVKPLDASGIAILLDSNRGIYIPGQFTVAFDPEHWNVCPGDVEILRAGPEQECYWDAWQTVLDTATYTDGAGNVWTLHQDGDLFAVCPELMTEDQHYSFFGEPKPVPEGFVEWEACSDCVVYIANGELPPEFAEEQDRRLERAVKAALSDYTMVSVRSVSLGFCPRKCELCGAADGDRHSVIGKPK